MKNVRGRLAIVLLSGLLLTALMPLHALAATSAQDQLIDLIN